MATNNAINLNAAGIVSYDGAGNFTGLANPLTVSNGGLGVSANTVYSVLIAGTTTTNPIQSLASIGTAGQVLTSNGAGVPPTFQTIGSASLITAQANTSSPLDARTYYIIQNATLTILAGGETTPYIVPKSGTIIAAYGALQVLGTLGSGESCTFAIRLNETTNYNITTSAVASSADNTFNNSAMSVPITAGDTIGFLFITPTWATNPTNVIVSITVVLQ
jgi:hypothetical protein